ncbi:MAG: 30S ribosomal protein S1 [Nitrososphaerales archaeon]
MDDGYWAALLREVEEEPDAARTVEGEEGGAGVAVARRWAVSAGSDSEVDWQRAEALLAGEELAEVRISGFNRGGLLADFGALQGFIPASHLITPLPGQSQEQRAAGLAARINETLKVRVVEIDRSRCRLILSERLARDNSKEAALLASLKPGQIHVGQVTSLCPFGAFVDLGGFEGLIHISELSWGRVSAPSDVVNPGDHVRVLVLETNPDEQKVALSLKRLQPDPWQGVEDRYHPGQIIDAVVTNVVNFGAFARVEEGLEGLIHVSELAEGSFMHPRNVIREGDRVRARVIAVDGAKRRIALTLRPADPLRNSHETTQPPPSWDL